MISKYMSIQRMITKALMNRIFSFTNKSQRRIVQRRLLAIRIEREIDEAIRAASLALTG